MSEPRWEELAGAYALDALEGVEKAAFEERLAQDAELRALVDEYRAAVAEAAEGSLGASAPPPELKDRVMSAARDARPPATDLGTRPDIRAARGGSPLPWIVLAASVAGLIWMAGENRGLREREVSLTEELAELRASLGDARVELARLDSLSRALVGPDVRFATLTGEARPEIRLLWNAGQGVLVVAVAGLPTPEPGRTYQLWGIRGNEAPVSLGTFATESDGTSVVVLAPNVASDFDVSAVTEEPAGGSPQPTSQPFLVGAWRSAQD